MARSLASLSRPAFSPFPPCPCANGKAKALNLKGRPILTRSFTRRTWSMCTSLSSSLEKVDQKLELEAFWQWLCARGLVSETSPLVRPAVVPQGLGLVAQRDISQNEVVVQVPKRLWINPDTVASSDIGSVCNGLKPWISVALFLVREKVRGDSPWADYLRILPDSTHSSIFWSDEELFEIQGTQLLSTTLGVKDYVQNEFCKVKEEIILAHNDLFPSVAYDDFLWAFGILRSRAFSWLHGESLVLIPFADLINHSSSIISEDIAWEIKGTGLFSRELVFSLQTQIPVKAGEQTASPCHSDPVQNRCCCGCDFDVLLPCSLPRCAVQTTADCQRAAGCELLLLLAAARLCRSCRLLKLLLFRHCCCLLSLLLRLLEAAAYLLMVLSRITPLYIYLLAH